MYQGWIQTSATSFQKLVKFFQTYETPYIYFIFLPLIYKSLMTFSVIFPIFLCDNPVIIFVYIRHYIRLYTAFSRLKCRLHSSHLYRSVVQSNAWDSCLRVSALVHFAWEFSTETSQSRISLAVCKSNYLCTSQNLLSLANGC